MLPRHSTNKLIFVLAIILALSICLSGMALGQAGPVSVTDTDPDNNATGVPVNIPEITVTFNTAVSQMDNFNKINIVESANPTKKVSINRDIRGGNVLVLQPLELLSYNTDYMVVIPSGAVGYSSGAMVITNKQHSFQFRTQEQQPQIALDVNPLAVNLSLGGQPQDLTVVVNPADADVSFVSGNGTVATVDGSGRIFPAGVGNTVVTVTAGKAGYTSAVREVQVTVGAGQITLDVLPLSVDLTVGGASQKLTVAVSPSDAGLNYASSDNAVATVDGAGNIAPVGIGSAVVTVTASKAGYTDAARQVQVTVGPGQITLDVLPLSVDLAVGGASQKLTVGVSPSDAGLTYVSSNNAVATVDGAGNIAPVGVGSAVVTVTASKTGYTDATRQVQVTVGPGQITLNVTPMAVNLAVGGAPEKLTVAVSPSDAGLTYVSSNNAVAAVDGDGNISPVGIGSAVVTVTASKAGYSNAVREVQVTVGQGLIALNVSPTTVNLTVGGAPQALTVDVSPADASITFSSGNTAVAAVSGTGTITPVGVGSTVVTVTASKAGYTDVTREVQVTVGLGQIVLNVSPTTVNLTVGGSSQSLTVSVTPNDANISYASSNTAVAAVSGGGIISPVAAGSAVITVTAGKSGYSDVTRQVNVTVTSGGAPPGPVEQIKVIDTDPDDQAQDIPENIPEITIVFNVNVEPKNNFTKINILENSTGAIVPINREIRGGNTLVLTPQAKLKSKTLYDVIMPSGAVGYQSLAGLITNQQYSFKFTTGQTIILIVSPNPVSIKAGQVQPLTVVTDPDGAAISYSSDNTSAATVNDSGIVKGICQGSAQIKVTASKPGYLNGEATVDVSVQKGDITLNVPAAFGITAGEAPVQLPVSADPADAALGFSSGNEGVVTVDENGYLTGVCEGTAVIRVTAAKDCYNQASADVTVTVQKGAINLTVPENIELTVGDAPKKITVAVDPADASVSYTTGDPAVATVDQSGNVTAVCEGSTTITVTASRGCYNSETRSVAVLVTKGQISLTAPGETIRVAAGKSHNLNVPVSPADSRLTFASENQSVAVVDSSGKITGVCVGTTIITVNADKNCYNSASATIAVEVYNGQIDLIVPQKVEISVGEQAGRIEVSVDPADAELSFSSENESVATVDGNGYVTPVCEGITSIRVTANRDCYNSESANVTVEVKKGNISLAVDPADVQLTVGGTRKITATAAPDGAAVKFSSSNTDVATVDQNTGMVKAVGVGTAEINVTASKDCYNDTSAIVTVTVTCLKGDVIIDGSINVQDIVRSVDFALEKLIPTASELCAADIDGDGRVTVLDVVKIVNMALEY